MSECSSKIDLEFAESNVVFGISHCCPDKNYSFWGLNRIEAEELIKKLAYIEQMTWKQLSALPRENGITPEIPGSKTYSMIDNLNDSGTKMIERYYFHFRVKQKELFRVLGYQYKNIFYITHLDTKGVLHH